jgi:DNA primase
MYTKYRLHYAPIDSVWNTLENKKLHEPRIVIPIFRGGLLVGWQARDVTGSSPIKYLTTPGWKKTEVLYNMDVAKWYSDVVLVEGPTDVWRVGDNAMALMGKTLAHGSIQAEILQTLWGDRGRCLICLDSYEDDPDTVAASAKLLAELDKLNVFPEGRAIFNLPNRDPGDWDHDELEALLNAAFGYLQMH